MALIHILYTCNCSLNVICYVMLLINLVLDWFIVCSFAAVHLPSLHHRWSVLNSSVAQVDSLIGLTKALSMGVTTVVVEDTRVAGHFQGSSINVVTPDTFILYMSPWSISRDHISESKPFPSSMHWYVVSGRQYLIQMKIFSGRPDAHEIYITEVFHCFLYPLCINRENLHAHV